MGFPIRDAQVDCGAPSLLCDADQKSELELELIQTHMTQKPVLRVEVGALGARLAKSCAGTVVQRACVSLLG